MDKDLTTLLTPIEDVAPVDMIEMEPNDPMQVELAQIDTQLANIKPLLSAQQRRCLPFLAKGELTYVDIAERAECSPATVSKAAKDKMVRRAVALIHRRSRIYSGPTEQQRAHMLWLIAKNNHEKLPNVAIKAIDTLNKQSGLYKPDLPQETGGLTVKINQFVVNTSPDTLTNTPKEDAPDHAGEVIEGEFSPVTVEVPDDTTE